MLDHDGVLLLLGIRLHVDRAFLNQSNMCRLHLPVINAPQLPFHLTHPPQLTFNPFPSSA